MDTKSAASQLKETDDRLRELRRQLDVKVGVIAISRFQQDI